MKLNSYLNETNRPAARAAILSGFLLTIGLMLAASALAAPVLPVGDFGNQKEKAAWATVTDKWAGGDSTISVELGKVGEQSVLSLRAKLGKKFAYPFAGARRYFEPGGVPTDMSSYKGVRLRVRGNREFKLQLQSSAVADHNDFAAQVPVTKEWSVVDLPFSTFSQNMYWGKQVKWNSAQLRGVVLFFEGLPGSPEAAVDVSSISFFK